MKIFSGTSNPDLAEKIAEKLNIKLSPLEIFVFPDGERRVRIEERVVDEHCIVVQPTNPPVDQNYMELFFLVDGLKRSGAEFVTAVMPYLGYQRQDHVFRDGEAVSLDVVAHTLESTGLDNLICVDLHSVRTPQSFKVPISHLSALDIFAEKIKSLDKNSILISPDMGGIARIKKLSGILDNMNFAAVEKNRSLETGAVEASVFGEGEVKGEKTAFIVDDMISSGKTIATSVDVLKKNGIEKTYVFATHAIFSEDAPDTLQNTDVEKVFVTDSVFVPEDKYFDKLEVLSVAGIIAEEINKG